MLKFSNATKQAKLQNILRWLSDIPIHASDAVKNLRDRVANGYKPKISSFSLPAGFSCPFARDCLSKADAITGKIKDGLAMKYRCFEASMEARNPNLRAMVWRNFEALRHLSLEEMVSLIYESVPIDADIIRIHVGGDFFNQRYFSAWLAVARLYPNKILYAYTKSVPYWVNELGNIPENLSMNGSKGGTQDPLLDLYDLKTAEVVFSPEDAEARGLEIDHDESHAILNTGNFGLLVHGTQPPGTEASEAIKDMKQRDIQFSYSR